MYFKLNNEQQNFELMFLNLVSSVELNPSELHGSTLAVESEGHALHVFVNNQLVGTIPLSTYIQVNML